MPFSSLEAEKVCADLWGFISWNSAPALFNPAVLPIQFSQMQLQGTSDKDGLCLTGFRCSSPAYYPHGLCPSAMPTSVPWYIGKEGRHWVEKELSVAEALCPEGSSRDGSDCSRLPPVCVQLPCPCNWCV